MISASRPARARSALCLNGSPIRASTSAIVVSAWRSCPMPQRVPYTRSSPITSSRTRGSSRMPGSAIAVWNDWATSTRGATSPRPQHEAKTQDDCSRACTGSRHWPNDGCWAHTRVQLNVNTSPTTSTNSRSGSTGVLLTAGGWCSTASSNSPSATIRCVTETWCSTPAPRGPSPTPPGATGHPLTLECPQAHRPWRHAHHSG